MPTTQQIVGVLNDAFKADPDAMDALVNARVSCNGRMTEHPTIQVGEHDGLMKVGLLGILNAIASVDDPNRRIGARMNDAGKLEGFQLAYYNGQEPAD